MSDVSIKKLIKTLGAIRGRHTELVTVYIPAGYSIHEVAGQLRNEQGTAENIKSKPVRKNVVSALDKIIRHLGLYTRPPANGLALFCGNISEKEGVTDIELWTVEPPEPLKTKMYWCDQKFVLEPLEEMIAEKEVYGIILLDKNEANIAFLRGKKIISVSHFESIVPGKTRAGGQSSMRFSRVREGLLNDWLKKIGEAANKTFEEQKDVIGILLSGPGPIKEMFLKEDYMHTSIKNKILGTVDVSYTGEFGLHETIDRAEDLLKEASVLKEKKILQRFFNEMQREQGLAVYGVKEVLRALEMGAVDTVIVSEETTMEEVEFECPCDETKIEYIRKADKNKKICPDCGQLMKVLGERDLIEAFEELVKNYNTKLVAVSSDTREGLQFEQLGGIGALLRYHV
ncbi:MAG: peptide chain release factor 1 [Candidatus Aenigmarchaeota archaeon]|nr:peptide chain release factor 1 [Candidatus Aenigmarchaeota archaeon]